MPYELTTHPKTGYLHIRVTGTNSPETVTDYMTEVGEICRDKNYNAVLIEENLEGPGLNMFEIFKVIRGIRDAPPQLRWIIYVDTNPGHDHFMMKFARDLAINRGLRVHVCRTLPDAEEWIKLLAL